MVKNEAMFFYADMDKIIPNPKNQKLPRKRHPISRLGRTRAKRSTKKDFCRSYVDPIRKEVEEVSDFEHLWFRCIPGEDVFHKNETTGELRYGFDAHRQLLTLLPKSAEETRKRYKREDKDLIIFSRQVAYLVIWFCQHHLITHIDDAFKMLGDWRPYLMLGDWRPYLAEPQWLKRMAEKKIRNVNP